MNNKNLRIQSNVTSGVVRVIINVALPFMLRTAMIYCLGAAYLGLSSLFTSILSVLSLAELGFSNAIVYSMYRPLALNDDDAVCALMAYYKKVYRIIGLVVLSVGVIITPFLTLFIKDGWPADINIYLLFLIYLANTSISYFFFAYKSALLNALQRIDAVNWTQTCVLLFQYVVQLAVLILFRNYYVYIIFTPLCTVAANLLIARYANRHYPQYQCRGSVNSQTKGVIGEKIKGLMIYKLSETARNSFDTIVLSSLLGLVVVAVYNNYYYIFCAAYSILVAINQGLQASVGNSIAVDSVSQNFSDMRRYNFRVMWLTAWFTCCLVCLYQVFIPLWAGASMVLSDGNAILFGVYFYVLNMNNVRNLYYDGCGLWLEGKWTFILEALSNLVLNIVLGALFGVTGVIVATIITIFVFSSICRTSLLFKHYFKSSPKPFIRDHLIGFAVTLIVCAATHLLCLQVTGSLAVQFLVRLAICALVPNIIMSLIFYKKLKASGLPQKLAGRLRKKG